MANYQVLIAKSDADDAGVWLPLWMHLKDTAGVMRKLVHRWVTPSAIQASGLSFDDFKKTAVFAAAVHDIGKATSYFQDIISARNEERRDSLYHEGYKLGYLISGKTPHSYAGQWILQSSLTGLGVKRSVAGVVGAHHGRPIEGDEKRYDLIRAYEKNFFGDEKNEREERRWKSVWRKITEDACDEAGISSADELPDLSLTAQVLLTGLLITADWIASSTEYFPLISVYDEGDNSLYPARTESGYSKVSFPEGWRSETFLMDSDTFRGRFGFYPNRVQQAVIETVNGCGTPGIFILEAEPGAGKTEAALSAAEVLASKTSAGGVFFGLPTQATSNGLFGRLYDWAASVSEDTAAAIRLAHGAAELNEDYEKLLEKGRSLVGGPDDEDVSSDGTPGVHPWFQGNKKALLADFVTGTVDQFLMASLKRKYFMLRHLGLAGKVVIIDECHAYDAYMNEYLDRSLEWMAAYGVPVILLSATLPPQRRQELVKAYVGEYCRYKLKEKYEAQDPAPDGAYPLLTWSDGKKVYHRTIEQKTSGKTVRLTKSFSMDGVVKKLDESLDGGGCACVIMNTVKAAQQVYGALKEGVKGAEVMLYHAQFTMPDRAGKERKLLKAMGKSSTENDRRRFILVGTQVLEQSLDYDADIMVTQPCPVDLLMQRVGRLHRHERRRPAKLGTPECVVLYEKDGSFDEGTKSVYGEYLLLKTLKAMGDRSEILIPDEIPVLVGQVYGGTDDDVHDDVLAEARETYVKSLKEKSVNAGKYLLSKPLKNKSIEGILVNENEAEEKYAECSVRDGESSIEVLLMKMRTDGSVGFTGDDDSEKEGISPDTVPEGRMGRLIARQRLRLPHIFSARWNMEKTINELEKENIQKLSAWQKSSWIKGELVLLLNEHGETDLCGYQLAYTKEKGLICIKEDADAGEGV